MDTNISNESKKSNLEELSKEELLKKCKGLLTIAQKAKQAKDILQEENNELKEELSNKNKNDASEEILERLTQQKLSMVTTIEDLKAKNSSLDSKLQIYEKELQMCQEKFNIVDNESVSYKRQMTRLTDENEQLITHLDSLEKQIDELNKIGIQQRQQLLELEAKARENKNMVEDNKVTELQSMLGVSLEEVKKLKSENSSLKEKMQNLEINLSEKKKNIVLISEELKSKCEILNTVSQELKELQNNKEIGNVILEDYEKLKAQCTELSETNKLLQEDLGLDKKLKERITELQTMNDRLREKLKLYHSKIIKLATNTKAIKEEKNTILQLFKQYTDQVTQWRDKLEIAMKNLVESVHVVQSENHKLKEDIAILKEGTETDLHEKINKAVTAYETQLKTLKQDNDMEIEVLNAKIKENELGYSKEVETLQKSIIEYKNLLDILNAEKEIIIEDLSSQKNIVSELTDDIASFKEENVKLSNDLNQSLIKNAGLTKEMENLLDSNKELQNEIDALLRERKSFHIVIKEQDANNKIQMEDYENKLLASERLASSLQTQFKKYEEIEKKLAIKSSEEIIKLVEENKELSAINNTLQEELDTIRNKQPNISHCDCQTDDDLIPTGHLEEQILNLRRENSELLSEMNEMNQALKERGENISKLEAHCEEIMKKLQIYETRANKNVDSITEKEEIIKQLTEELSSLKRNEKNGNLKDEPSKQEEIDKLKTELENLREKLNSNLETSYAESESMSTSTISRTEEMNRLKDLEGSWEERYGKLRNLAIKLKGKIRGLTNTLTKEQGEKEELQKNISEKLKTIQTLQNQSDKLEDELENSKQECKQYLNRLNAIAEDISKDKQSLVNQDDVISDLKKEIDILKAEKQSTENWKKQVSAKVQTLRKELEANNVLKKDFENKIGKLTADLEAKEQALRAEIDSHKQTKSLLDASNNECKKNSVLNLEMQDYERSVKETAKKLEKQQEQMTKWKGQVESQKSTINALREQNKMLEERVKELEDNLNSSLGEINTYKKKISQLEDQVVEKEEKIQSLNDMFETSRAETEEVSTELSKVIAEHQKANNVLKNERDLLRSQTLGLQQSLREVQDALKLKEDELIVIRSEYEGYKVRAQSVLRQNQSRDVGLEEKLNEEVANLKVQNVQLTGELDKTLERIKVLEEANEKMTFEKMECCKKIQELEVDTEEMKAQYAQLSSKHQTSLSEHTETIRSLKLHADTLSQCYRQQMADQESRHNREVIELQSRIEKSSTPIEAPTVPPTMTREEGEGSESIESVNPPKMHPVPLERLLGSDSDQEFVHLKKQLTDQESKLVHLTALLADTEQDLAKHVQMNKLLKEEIRRQQRSEEREKHAENLEYLKNVVFKFVTLHNGDERSRLVPVLNTILKLSPEETQKLNTVVRGDSGIKGWANYLPTWSSPNKP